MTKRTDGAGTRYENFEVNEDACIGQSSINRISEPIIPLNLLVFLKPPARFRDTTSRDIAPTVSHKTGYSTRKKNDKVVVILQNILRNLENDIEHDRRRLKDERRKRQKHRRLQREERYHFGKMTASRATATRREFSTLPHKSHTFREEIYGGSTDRKAHVFRRGIGEIRKHDSLSFADTRPKSRANQQSEFDDEVGTRSLERRIRRKESFGVSDWSRYSRAHEDDTEAAYLSCEESSCESTENKTSGVNSSNFYGAEAHIEPNSFNRQPECQRVSVCNNSTQALDDYNISDNSVSSSDAQCTPTNIRRKLQSFEILPNFRRNGKEMTKTSDIEIRDSEAGESSSGLVPRRPRRPVYDNSDASRCYDDSSGEDDDLDIVFPSTERKDRYQGVKFYIGKEFGGETPVKENTKSREPALTLRYDGAVARFRKKQKLQCPSTAFAGMRDKERPTSAGTSGYSTDEYSCKTTHSEDECFQERKENEKLQRAKQTKNLKKYFLLLQNGFNMALQVDESSFQNGDSSDESCRSFLQNISMSDLAIPDHVGWLVDQSEQNKVWGVIVDMLFCVFEGKSSAKPRDVIILPGCNIRPLVYNTAIKGLHINNPSQTITGISKFQFVIDDSSSGRKHVFGVETQTDLDTWYKVLKKASALDPEVKIDMSTSNDSETTKPTKRCPSFDGVFPDIGYMPSQDSTRRSQRMRSPRGAHEKPNINDISDDASGSTCVQDSLTNGCQASPRSAQGLMRNDSRRQSISDFKKRLRQETKPELSKQLPVKATHFKQPTESGNYQVSQSGKKLRSFGSFESLLRFKRKKRKSSDDTISNDDVGSIVSTGSIVSGSSIEQASMTCSVDISASVSQLQKKKGKKLSRSLELSEPKNGMSNGIVRRASDIKDRVFNRRPSKPYAKLGDLHDTSMHGFLLHKHHLKWQKLWCVVCRGCFYGFKSNSPEENAQIEVLLANCGVIFVSQQDKKQKHLYIFKLSQEKSKSIYLCANDYRELMKWLTILKMESNSVISNVDRIGKSPESENDSICSSLSSQSGSVLTVSSNEHPTVTETSRSRSKKNKKAPAKPPRKFRNSSCPPPATRELDSLTGEDTLISETMSSSADNTTCTYGSTEDLPRYDKAVAHVWQNDRGYLFNAIRAKLSAYRKKDGTFYNKDLPGTSNEGLMIVQDGTVRKGSKDVRRSRSFNAHSSGISGEEETVTLTPTESPTYARKRHKPLVVKKISASDLEEEQTIAGYIEKKSVSAQWIRYWYVLHEGTLFCFLTSDDNVTVDVLNLHGYSVGSLVDKFRGKRFVLQLSHENFTSVYLSMESREDMETWQECLEHAIQQPTSSIKEAEIEQGACAGCDSSRQDEVGEKRKHVKQKLLEEMLRQKYELERKQAERQKKQRSKGLDSMDGSPSSPFPPDFLSEEQRTSDVTRLRQRRMSTQLKVETIQKQIEKPSGTKRGLFGFGKSKKLGENKNMFLQDQLKELNDKLQKIDTDLSQVESEKYLPESYDVNQNRKSMPVSLTGLNSVEHGLEDEDTRQTTSIKNAVQKWTNKTFSKVSVKRRQAGNDSVHLNERLPNTKQNSDIDINSGFENGIESDSNQDEQNSLDSSVTDLTRPLAGLKLDLYLPLTQNSQSGSASTSSVGYNRSNSRTSTLSSLSSPRREIDPSVLAEINAFEELTRQVLEARSKETPTK